MLFSSSHFLVPLLLGLDNNFGTTNGMRDALISSDDEATDVGLDYDDVSDAEIFLTEDIAEGLVTSSQSQRCYIPNFCIIFWV